MTRVTKDWLKGEIDRLSKMLAELDDGEASDVIDDLRNIVSAYSELLSRAEDDERSEFMQLYARKSGDGYVILSTGDLHSFKSDLHCIPVEVRVRRTYD